MSERAEAGRKARLIFFSLALLLCACSKHDVQYPTPWLRVDVSRPRSDALIRIGSAEERYEVKSAGGWQKLGVGHRSGYTILGEEALTASAVVVYLDDPRGPVLVRSDAPPRRLEGAVTFANAVSLDVMQNSEHAAHIERYDAMRQQTTTFDLSIPDAYSDCRIDRVLGYSNEVPYVRATCEANSSGARCLLIAAGKPDGLYIVKAEQPQSDCDFPQLRLSLSTPTYRHFD